MKIEFYIPGHGRADALGETEGNTFSEQTASAEKKFLEFLAGRFSQKAMVEIRRKFKHMRSVPGVNCYMISVDTGDYNYAQMVVRF